MSMSASLGNEQADRDTTTATPGQHDPASSQSAWLHPDAILTRTDVFTCNPAVLSAILEC
jgi:hypothetical protein